MLISLAVFFILAKKLRMPYTAFLVVSGSLLVPISKIDVFSFITN